MEKNYKIKLTNRQIQGVYSMTDNKEKQSKIMSILAYLMKYTDAETMKLVKSLNRLYIMYLRYHNYIARSYFYKIAKELIDNDYFLNYRENEKIYSLADKVNDDETVENSELEDNSKKPNNKTNNIQYTYTSNTTSVVKVAAIDLVEDLFKSLKIKSKEIKNMVRSKIQNIQLDSHGAIAYLMKVITEKTEQYNVMRNNYTAKVAESKKTYTYSNGPKKLRFDNFEPRSYNYDELENKLLGWDK